jgi:phage tail protein X
MADVQTTPYITRDGDRWDLIADKAYGDITKQKDIIELNPYIALVARFPDGVTVLLPIIPEADTQTSNLPPWKR